MYICLRKWKVILWNEDTIWRAMKRERRGKWSNDWRRKSDIIIGQRSMIPDSQNEENMMRGNVMKICVLYENDYYMKWQFCLILWGGECMILIVLKKYINEDIMYYMKEWLTPWRKIIIILYYSDYESILIRNDWYIDIIIWRGRMTLCMEKPINIWSQCMIYDYQEDDNEELIIQTKR